MDRLTPERLEALLERAAAVRVLVIGDVMLDVYLRGGASRISPEAPVPVVHIRGESRALGGAANVAANVVSLGASCVLGGCIGDDEAGNHVRRAVADAHIREDGLVRTVDRPTTVKTRVMVRQHQVARYDRESDKPLNDAIADVLAERVARLASTCDVIAVEDYDKGVLTPVVIDAVLGRVHAHGRPVIVDPKARSFFAYGGATVFKPNASELASALRASLHPEEAGWLQEVRTRLACDHLLLTLGEGGMALATAEGRHLRVPTAARSVYDVSGAGDTVTAALAVALGAGATIEEAAVLANHAAGIEVGKAGVATVTPDELRAVVREHHARRAADPAT